MSSGPPPPGGSRPPKQPVALPMQLKNNSSSRTWVDVAQGKPPQSTPSKSISAQPNPSEPATAVESTKTPSTAHPTAVSSTAGTISHTGATGTTGSSTASSLSGATPAFEPKTTEKIPSPPEPNRFRARGNLLTNHFQVHFGNAQTIYEYSLGIVQVHPAPAGANPTIIRRIRRRVVYLFTQQLMHGAVITLPANAPQPPANPTTASGARAPATGTQAQALDKHGQKGACEAKPATSQQSDGGKSSPPPVLQGTLLASDYHDTLITLTKVPDQHVGAVYRLNYYEDWENGPSNNPMQFRITMTLLPEIDPHQMLQDLANPIQSNVTVGERNNFLRAFNILFSHRANLRTFQDIPRQRVQLTAVTSSKKFFDLFPSNTTPQQPPATAPWQLNAAMDALPGYFLSSRAVINGNLILNVNTMTSAFYHPFTANSSLNGLITALESLPQRPGRREVQAHLKDIRVKTNYLVQHGGAREVCYSITGVPNVGNHWATAADVITRVVDPTTQQRLTVHQYFQRNYPHAHVVRADRVVSLGRNVTIPAKLLQVLNGSPVKQKTDMVRHAVRMPDVNRRMIVNEGKTLFGFIPITAQNLQQPVDLFSGITIDQSLLNIAARMLTAPDVGYAHRRAIFAGEARNGFWNLRQRQFVEPYRAPLGEYWSYVQLTQPPGFRHTPIDDLQDWSAEVARSLRQYGITANLHEAPPPGAPHFLQVSTQQDQNAVTQDENNLQKWIEGLQQLLINKKNADKRQPLKVLFVLLPEHSVPLYALVKRVADQICGVPTICHVSRGRRRPKLRNPRRFDVVPDQEKSSTWNDGSRQSDSPRRGHQAAEGPRGQSGHRGFQHRGRGQSGQRDYQDHGRGRGGSRGGSRGENRGSSRGGGGGDGGGYGGGHGDPTPAYWGPDSAPGFLANLFMKFNLKANEDGANQALLANAPILDDDTMLLGADVTHAGAGAMQGAPSIAAVVGSVEGHFSQFPASFRQNLRQTPTGNHKVGLPNEEILSLAAMVSERVEAYMRRRNKAPCKLIVYRDGLSEAQLDMCTNNELPQIRQGIREAMVGKWKSSQEPQVMLICTIKRHHTRLYPGPGNPDREIFFDHGNPLPGCMVSDGITLDKGMGDFFLVSHEAIKGTARPTHYVVLANDNKEHLNDIACMTNSLCYLFQRATRSVGLAPPSYYADLAADRARHYVRDIYAPFAANQGATWTAANNPMNLNVHNNLTDNMFYI